MKVEKSGKSLVLWYRGRLKDVFGYASRAARIRNTRGGHLYYLLLASPNRTGVKIADHILSDLRTIGLRLQAASPGGWCRPAAHAVRQ